MKTVSLAVRDFALPCPRSGSIDMHSGLNLLQQGQEIHEELQSARKASDPSYRSELKLSRSFERGDYKFIVTGRIDGLYDRMPPLIEEIKSTLNIHQLQAKLEMNREHPYILQLRTYGYIYFLQTGIEPLLRLLLVSSGGSAESSNIDLGLDRSGYESWLEKRLDELVSEMKTLEADLMRRIDMGAKMTFPFKQARQGQLELVESVKKSIGQGETLMVQAATGLGKTVALMYPSWKDALLRGQKLVYLTPKNSQHSVAENAALKLKEECTQTDSTQLRSLTMSAKAKICFKPEPICTPEYCQYARDYYDKLSKHNLIELMAQKPHLNFEVFQELGQEYEVCPFELSLEAVARSDLLIADYNYVFSPRSILGRITQHNELIGQKPNLLIDEAHNLPDRACDYYSPVLKSELLLEAKPLAGSLSPGLSISAQAILNRSLELLENTAKAVTREAKVTLEKEEFLTLEKKWKEFLAGYIQSNQHQDQKDALIRAAHSWTQFCDGIGNLNESDFFVISKRYGKKLELKITCCNASAYLEETYKQFQSSIAFSATLKPFHYYTRLIGFDSNSTKTIECRSPFPKANRKLLLIPQVSTKYSDRSKNYDKISDAIVRISSLRRGNYFAFFPSFEFLNEVATRVEKLGIKVFCQKQEMRADEIRQVIEGMLANKSSVGGSFVAGNSNGNGDGDGNGNVPGVRQSSSSLFFAVQGGVFSEGVDYPGDSLIGAMIIGPALPKYELERELLREYYERQYKQGFDYAYTYPAMTRVIQSAGRVIRSENDRGIIVLMDQRFMQKTFAEAMPDDWYDNSVKELVSCSILKDLNDFWQQLPDNDNACSHTGAEE